MMQVIKNVCLSLNRLISLRDVKEETAEQGKLCVF